MTNKNANDSPLEFFILTYNRVVLLGKTLQSLLNQTIKIKTTVVDNASDDNTQDMVNELIKTHPYLNYYKQPKHLNTFHENLQKAQELATKKYVCFFHDDDIVHPQFAQIVLNLIDRYDDLDLICTLFTPFSNDTDIHFKKLNDIAYCFFDNKLDFASYIYASYHLDGAKSLCFPSLVFKTQNIKNIKMNIDIGGKAADKPFALSSLQNGKCIQIREPDIFMYRHHEAQDTYSKTINPNPKQIFEHQKFFKNILKQNKFCYYAFSLEWLEVFYRWGNNDCSKKAKRAFLKEAHKQHLLRKIDLYRRIGMFKKICSIIRKRWHKSIKKTTMNPKMHHIEIG